MALASFSCLLTPLGRHRRVALASCTLLLASTSLTHFSPPTALAFSHQPNAPISGSSYSTSVLSSPLSPYLASTRGSGIYRINIKHQTHESTSNVLKSPASINIGNARPSLALYSNPRKHDIDLTALPSDAADEGVPTEKEINPPKQSSSLKNDLQSIITLIGAQALLIPVSVFVAKLLHIPNRGLGVGFALTYDAAVQGLQWTSPLFLIAGIMRLIEPYSPALQGVTEATQRSVLAVMGKERRPVFALLVSILLGAAAGLGEEWLFRGVFQTALTEKFSSGIALTISGIVFGLLHAVTPVYALLAGAASVFFGYLYNISDNLAVPMICHAVYDVGALMWAHWGVTSLSSKEQDKILESGPGAPIMEQL